MTSKIRDWKRSRTLGWFPNMYLRYKPCFLLIGLGHFFLKFPSVARIHEIDGSAAKSATGHARAVNAFMLVREVHHQIQFAAADFVQIAQTGMRFRHAHSKPSALFGTQRRRAVEHARVFRDYVQRAFVNDLGEHVAMLFKLIDAHVAQSSYSGQNSSEPADGLFAIRATAIIFAGG